MNAEVQNDTQMNNIGDDHMKNIHMNMETNNIKSVVPSTGSKYLKQFSEMLGKMEETEVEIKSDEIESDFSRFGQINGQFDDFQFQLQKYLDGTIQTQLEEYFKIINRPVDSRNPFVHLNEGRIYLISMIRELHRIYLLLGQLNGTSNISEEQSSSSSSSFSSSSSSSSSGNGSTVPNYAELVLAWAARCYYQLGDNFERTEETKAGVQRFIICLNILLGLSPAWRSHRSSGKCLAWDSAEDAKIELLKVLNSLGIAACNRSSYWEGVGYFKRSQVRINI